jgi:hypothetical protein
MSRLDVVSCRWRIYWTGSSLAHLTSQDTICPSRSFWSLWWPWYWQLMAITPIFHFKREPNISCSRTQFSITTAYGILSIRPFRALCWTSATAILHRVSWPSLDYCLRRVRYCESEERGGRAEQHVSNKYSGPRSWQSDSLQLLPQWHGYIPLPPRSLAIVHPIPAIPLLLMIPHASSERPEEWRGKLFAKLLRRRSWGTIVINRERVSVS